MPGDKGPSKSGESRPVSKTTPNKRIVKPVKGVEAARKTGDRARIAHEVAHALAKPGGGKLHASYKQEVLKISESIANSYRAKLRKMKISDIRRTARILKTKSGKETAKQRVLNLREEQARRIKTYCDKVGTNTFRLNYTKVAASHYWKVGLGEVFVNSTLLRIKKKDGTIVMAKRMVVPSGRHRGRLAFCNIADNSYVATFDGDEVTIMDNQQRVDINNKAALAAHIKILDQEEATRRKHADSYAKGEELFDTSSYTPGLGPFKRGGSMDKILGSSNVMAKFKESFWRKLSPTQRRNATYIATYLKKAGFNSNIIAGALANAYKESSFRMVQSCCRVSNRGWNERGWLDAKGRLREDSWGWFQENAPSHISMKRGMSAAQKAEVRARRAQFRKDMLNPEKHMALFVQRLRGRRGRRVRQARTPFEAAYYICTDIEIPANRHVRGMERARYLNRMLKFEQRPRETAIAQWTRTPDRIGRLAKHPNVRIRVKNGQDKWVFASSTGTLMEMGRGLFGPSTGMVAIGAYNARNFFRYFKRHVWPRISHFKMPKKIVIAGLYLNGVGSYSPRKALEHHMEIVNFFKTKGVDVKIATCQPYPKHRNKILAFNQLLRDKGLTENRIDLAKKVAPNGTCQRGTLADGLHLSYRARKQFVRDIENA